MRIKVINFKSVFSKAVAAGLVVIIGGCATVKPDFYPQAGAPHTITYKDDNGKEQTVFDLSGNWKTKYNNSTGYDAFEEIVKITQEKNKFRGIKTIGNEYLSAGELTISGKIIGNIFECYTYSRRGIINIIPSKLTEKVDEFECQGDEVRKYKRIK